MSEALLPALINEAAAAGGAGVAVVPSPELAATLEAARAWRFPLDLRDGRLYLERDADLLTPAWIAEETPTLAWPRLEIAGYLTVGSTNEAALERARAGATTATLVYAESQTAGRGRKHRAWHSPPGDGLYFTLLVRPAQPLARWPLLALAAGIAVARAVEEIPELRRSERPGLLELKWPNDVQLGGKKCAGILVETASRGSRVVAAAIGVGLNTGTAIVLPALAHRATSLEAELGVRIGRRRLLVGFLRQFQELYQLFERGSHQPLLEEWKRRSSMWHGTAVRIEDGGGVRDAVTCGLTETGALRVRNSEGIDETLVAGDVSVLPRAAGRYHSLG